jgi:PmbA protein
MNDGQELLGRAERLVQLALNRGADEAECYYEKGAGVEVELEAGRIANTSASQGLGAGLRILKGGRLGFAYLTRDEQAPTAIALALRQARLAPKKNFHLPASTKAKPIARRWDERVAALDVQDAIALADGLLAGAKEGCPKATVSGGGASLSSAWLAIASSAGVAVWDRQTSNGCSVSLTLAEGERSISAGETDSRHRFDLDPHAVAMEATSTVNALRKPKPAGKSGTFQILLRPESAAELVTGGATSWANRSRRRSCTWPTIRTPKEP